MNNNYNQGNFGGQGQGNNNNKGSFSNHAKVQFIGNLTKDPESRSVGGAKVAVSTLAVNHRGNNSTTDFWDIEIWVNEGQSSYLHDFVMDYCGKGRQVFVEGIPQLKRKKRQQNGQDVLDVNGKAIYDYFPSIRAQVVIGLQGGGQGQSQGGNKQQQGNFNAGGNQPQGNFGGGQQQGFGGQQQQGFGGQPQQGFSGQPQQGFGAPNQQGAPGGFGVAPGGFGAPTGSFNG